MKKFSCIIVVFMLTMCLLSHMCYAAVKYDDPAKLSVTDSACFEPYPVAQNATKYTPWFTMYHMQTEEHYNRGLRGGEGGQMIMSFGISPVNPNLMLMGSDTGGLWRSIDGGENWYSLTDNNNMRGGMGIAFHPEKENVVFCVQGNKGVSSSVAAKATKTKIDGLYRSIDGGISWEQVLDKDIICDARSQGLIQFDSDNNVYVLTSDGVCMSENDGETWTELVNFDFEKGGVFNLCVSEDGRTMIAATEKGGIVISTSGGIFWEERNADLKVGASSVAVDPFDLKHWYAIFFNEKELLFETFDGGISWSPRSYYTYAEKNKPAVVKAIYIPDKNIVRLFLIYNEMARPIRYSDDGGNTWIEPKSNYTDTFTKSTGYNVESLSFCKSNPNIALFSFGDVIYKSTDGGASFSWSCGGYSGNYASDFDFDEKGRLLISFVDRGMARTDTPYTKGVFPTAKLLKPSGTVQSTVIDPDNENHMYLMSGSWTNQTLYESNDCGITWTPHDDIVSAPACNVLEYHKKNHYIIYTTSHTSFDGGNTWTSNKYYISSVSPVNSDVLYAANGKGVVRSMDCGKTWSTVIDNISEPKSIRADNKNQEVVWIGCFDGTIIRTDGQEQKKYGKENGIVKFGDAVNTICVIAQNPKNSNHLLIGATSSDGGIKTCGLFETYDGGETWNIVKGLPSARNVQRIAFSPLSDEVFIGTCSEGTIIYDYNVYKNWQNGIAVNDKSDEILLQSDKEKVRVMINGKTISFDQEAFIQNDRVLVPLRKIFEELDAEVFWNEAENKIEVKKQENTIIIRVDDDTATVNGKNVTLDVPAVIINGRTFVPLRFVAENLNANVFWNERLMRVEIN